ncbi:Cucumber peeling cupredoxin [Heracleum sosnowskyi]|uniref:Cucumber peeling cupredoxin n=1 Tax=Heracleum sosnowskyi TaxID=360622 RepID=A0AAD8JFY3_9APIA|nr:Cucumber peeling cupredoxin [Heracleum sosnowskyi]
MARLNMVVVFLTVMVMAAAMQMQSTDAQKTHYVGGSTGWIIPTSTSAYTTWAASQTFTVGDTLVFNFTTGAHTAAQVKKAAYDACTTTNPIAVWTTGPSSVKLTSTGPHYYICTIPSHCNPLGQKVTINVVSAAATSPASAPSPTVTSSTGAPTPDISSIPSADAPGSTSTPGSAEAPGKSARSSASFVATALPFTFLSIAIMALFN